MSPVRRGLTLGLLLAALVGVFLASLGLGQLTVGVTDILASLAGHGTPLADLVVWKLRLPRTGAATLAGALLALAGLLLQAAARNPLAEASTMGLTPTAIAVVALTTIVWPTLPAWLVPILGVTGGLAAATVIATVQRFLGAGSDQLVIAGLAVSVTAQAITTLALVLGSATAQTTLVWLTGSTQATAGTVVAWLILPTFTALLVVRGLADSCDLLWCDDGLSVGRGFLATRGRLVVTVTAAVLIAGSVWLAGAVGFVGLVTPLLTRRLVGSVQHRHLVWSTAALGGVLTVTADLIGRLLLAPLELPAGVMTALIGGPVFLAVLRARSQGVR